MPKAFRESAGGCSRSPLPIAPVCRGGKAFPHHFETTKASLQQNSMLSCLPHLVTEMQPTRRPPAPGMPMYPRPAPDPGIPLPWGCSCSPGCLRSPRMASAPHDAPAPRIPVSPGIPPLPRNAPAPAIPRTTLPSTARGPPGPGPAESFPRPGPRRRPGPVGGRLRGGGGGAGAAPGFRREGGGAGGRRRPRPGRSAEPSGAGPGLSARRAGAQRAGPGAAAEQRCTASPAGRGRHGGRALRRAARRRRGGARRRAAERGGARPGPAGPAGGAAGRGHAMPVGKRCLLEMETLDHSANMASPRRGCPSRAGACSAPCCAGGWRRPGSPRPLHASPAPPAVPAPAPPASSTAQPAGWSARGPASPPPPRRCEYRGAGVGLAAAAASARCSELYLLSSISVFCLGPWWRWDA